MARYKLNRTRLEDATRIIADELRQFKQGPPRKGKDLRALHDLEEIANLLTVVALRLLR
jgi:hypothetical protein